MIEGRVLADGTLEVGPPTARPEVLRQLLVLSIALGSVGTVAGGLRAMDQIGPEPPAFFAAASRFVAADTEVALLAADAVPVELADVDVVQVVVTEPVTAVIDTSDPARGVVDVEKVAAEASTTVSTSAAATTSTTAPVPTTTSSTTSTVAAPVTTTTTAAPAPSPPPAPPATAAAAPAPAGAAPVRTYTADEVKAIIAEVFGPADTAGAVKVASCESGLNPRAISKGGGNWGLFQINKVHRQRVANMGFAWEDLLDPRVNSTVAKAIFDDSGWGPWACNP